MLAGRERPERKQARQQRREASPFRNFDVQDRKKRGQRSVRLHAYYHYLSSGPEGQRTLQRDGWTFHVEIERLGSSRSCCRLESLGRQPIRLWGIPVEWALRTGPAKEGQPNHDLAFHPATRKYVAPLAGHPCSGAQDRHVGTGCVQRVVGNHTLTRILPVSFSTFQHSLQRPTKSLRCTYLHPLYRHHQPKTSTSQNTCKHFKGVLGGPCLARLPPRRSDSLEKSRCRELQSGPQQTSAASRARFRGRTRCRGRLAPGMFTCMPGLVTLLDCPCRRRPAYWCYLVSRNSICGRKTGLSCLGYQRYSIA